MLAACRTNTCIMQAWVHSRAPSTSIVHLMPTLPALLLALQKACMNASSYNIPRHARHPGALPRVCRHAWCMAHVLPWHMAHGNPSPGTEPIIAQYCASAAHLGARPRTSVNEFLRADGLRGTLTESDTAEPTTSRLGESFGTVGGLDRDMGCPDAGVKAIRCSSLQGSSYFHRTLP